MGRVRSLTAVLTLLALLCVVRAAHAQQVLRGESLEALSVQADAVVVVDIAEPPRYERDMFRALVERVCKGEVRKGATLALRGKVGGPLRGVPRFGEPEEKHDSQIRGVTRAVLFLGDDGNGGWRPFYFISLRPRTTWSKELEESYPSSMVPDALAVLAPLTADPGADRWVEGLRTGNELLRASLLDRFDSAIGFRLKFGPREIGESVGRQFAAGRSELLQAVAEVIDDTEWGPNRRDAMSVLQNVARERVAEDTEALLQGVRSAGRIAPVASREERLVAMFMVCAIDGSTHPEDTADAILALVDATLDEGKAARTADLHSFSMILKGIPERRQSLRLAIVVRVAEKLAHEDDAQVAAAVKLLPGLMRNKRLKTADQWREWWKARTE